MSFGEIEEVVQSDLKQKEESKFITRQALHDHHIHQELESRGRHHIRPKDKDYEIIKNWEAFPKPLERSKSQEPQSEESDNEVDTMPKKHHPGSISIGRLTCNDDKARRIELKDEPSAADISPCDDKVSSSRLANASANSEY